MTLRRFARLFSRRTAWVWCLALCLPLAQMAAQAHGLSHVREAHGGPFDDPRALQLDHCDLCVVAAAVAAGGLAMSPAPWGLVEPGSPTLNAMPQPLWRTCPTLGYQSRAPPLTLV